MFVWIFFFLKNDKQVFLHSSLNWGIVVRYHLLYFKSLISLFSVDRALKTDNKKSRPIKFGRLEKRKLQELTCIVFNDAHEFDIERKFINFGLTDQSSFESFEINFEICGSSGVVFACCFSDSGRFFSIDGDDLAGFDDE